MVLEKRRQSGNWRHDLMAEGKTVMLAAGDTFRAGAIDQLVVWGERAGVEVIRQSEGSDPAAVMYDAIRAAKNRKVDVLICDTAGRLQNKVNLMNELEKVHRVIRKKLKAHHMKYFWLWMRLQVKMHCSSRDIQRSNKCNWYCLNEA